MKALGISKSKSGYNYAVVEAGHNVIATGSLADLSVKTIDKALAEFGLSQKDIDQIATLTFDDIKLGDLENKHSQYSNEEVKYFSVIPESDINLSESFNYPILYLNDSLDATSLVLANSSTDFKKVSDFEERSLESFFATVNKILGQKDLFVSADLGDDSVEKFNVVANSERFSLKELIAQLESKVQKYKQEQGLSNEVAKQMHEFWAQDISAGLAKTIINSLLLIIFANAQQLGVTHIGIVGKIADWANLRSSMGAEAELLGYKVRFPQFPAESIMAVSLAGIGSMANK